jgi:hypothetical protein
MTRPSLLVIVMAWLTSGLAAAVVDAAELSCSSSRPVALEGEVVQLRAWASKDVGASGYEWSATGGKVVSTFDKASWDFSGVEPGAYRATARAATRSGSMSCTVEVFYQREATYRSGGREPARALLPVNGSEPAGYGLYTYLLFGAPMTERNAPRYRAAVRAYLDLAVALEEIERYFERPSLNLFAVPVLAADGLDAKPTADDLLKRYDFARARLVLTRVEGPAARGVYLVSSRTPLAAANGAVAAGEAMVQDLSTVPPEVVDLWVREFLNLAAQGRQWDDAGFRTFLLRVRTVIQILATGYLPVSEAVSATVKLVSLKP